MCNREYDSTGQNCWGVCLREDVLRTVDDPGCNPSEYEDPTACNMRDWIIDKVEMNVAEIETFFRVRQLEGNVVLTADQGNYAQIYAQYGLGGVECGRPRFV